MPQQRHPVQQSQHKKRLFDGSGASQQWRDYPVLGQFLKGLHPPDRSDPATTDLFQQRIRIISPGHRTRQDIGSGHRVLDGDIYADSGNRRHCVGRVANDQQAGPIPALQPIQCHFQHLDLIPAGNLVEG